LKTDRSMRRAASNPVTLDTEKLFSKLKSHELSRKGRPNHDAFFSSKALITGARVGGHVANPTNTTDSFALEFALSSLCVAPDKQYESIPDDEIALLARKFRALYRFRKERRRSPRGYFECGDTTHFNWYQSRFGHLLVLTGFVTRRRHRERCCQACGLQWRGFQLLEEPNLQLSLEPGPRHLGDHLGGVRDPGYTRPRDPR
jgi:hypothetical protein